MVEAEAVEGAAALDDEVAQILVARSREGRAAGSRGACRARPCGAGRPRCATAGAGRSPPCTRSRASAAARARARSGGAAPWARRRSRSSRRRRRRAACAACRRPRGRRTDRRRRRWRSRPGSGASGCRTPSTTSSLKRSGTRASTGAPPRGCEVLRAVVAAREPARVRVGRLRHLPAVRGVGQRRRVRALLVIEDRERRPRTRRA